MSTTLTLSLLRPVSLLGERIDALRMRAPTAGDIRLWPANGARSLGEMMDLIATLADVSPGTVAAMAPGDVFAAVELLGPFFDRPSPGATSVPSVPGDMAGLPPSSGGSGSTS